MLEFKSNISVNVGSYNFCAPTMAREMSLICYISVSSSICVYILLIARPVGFT